MRQRVITAIVFGAIVITAILASPISFQWLWGIIALFVMWELSSVIGLQPIYRVLITSLVFVLWFGMKHTAIILWLQWAILLWLAVLGILYLLLRQHNTSNLLLGLFSMVYVAFPFGLASNMGTFEGTFTPTFFLGCMVLIWGNDSFAYLTGRQWGHTKLAPRISPKKTWEGWLGGLVGTLLLSLTFSSLLGGDFGMKDWIMTAAVVGIFGPFGDLFQSMFKRKYNIKDSGHILPGHGGFWDRFDAFMFVIPFVFILWWYVIGWRP